MFFLQQFRDYAKESNYEQNEIDTMIDYLKILNKFTWSKKLIRESPTDHIYIDIKFENIYDNIVTTFFYDSGGEKNKEKLTISDDDENKHKYKYKYEDDDDVITNFFRVNPFLLNIKEIFDNAVIREGGIKFTTPSDRTIGKIFQEIDNILFNQTHQTFLEHLKFKYLEPVNEGAKKYMNDELEKGYNYRYYFHTKFFQTLIEIFITGINKSYGDGTKNYVESLYDKEKEDEFGELKNKAQAYRDRKQRRERQEQMQRERQEQIQKEVEILRKEIENAEAEKKQLQQNAQDAITLADAEKAERQKKEVMLNEEKEKVRLMEEAKQREEEKTIQTDIGSDDDYESGSESGSDDDLLDAEIVLDTDESDKSAFSSWFSPRATSRGPLGGSIRRVAPFPRRSGKSAGASRMAVVNLFLLLYLILELELEVKLYLKKLILNQNYLNQFKILQLE